LRLELRPLYFCDQALIKKAYILPKSAIISTRFEGLIKLSTYMNSERGVISRRDFIQGRFGSEEKPDVDPSMEIHRFKLNGVHIDFMGVTHIPETFTNHYETIHESIGRADMVVAEYLPFETEFQAKVIESFPRILSPTECTRFYNHIVAKAQEWERPIASVDPDNNRLWTGLIRVVPHLATSISAISCFNRLCRSLSNSGRKSDEPTSRRDFLKIAGFFSLDTYLNFNTSARVLLLRTISQQQGRVREQISNYGIDDQLICDGINFRNTIAGSSLSRLCQHLHTKGQNRLVVFYGKAHTNPIMEYATNQHPLEKAWKTIPMKLHGLFTDESIRIYDPTKDGRWIKREEIG